MISHVPCVGVERRCPVRQVPHQDRGLTGGRGGCGVGKEVQNMIAVGVLVEDDRRILTGAQIHGHDVTTPGVMGRGSPDGS